MYFKLPKMFYLSQLFINSMFAFLLQELQYIYVTGYWNLSLGHLLLRCIYDTTKRWPSDKFKEIFRLT